MRDYFGGNWPPGSYVQHFLGEVSKQIGLFWGNRKSSRMFRPWSSPLAADALGPLITSSEHGNNEEFETFIYFARDGSDSISSLIILYWKSGRINQRTLVVQSHDISFLNFSLVRRLNLKKPDCTQRFRTTTPNNSRTSRASRNPSPDTSPTLQSSSKTGSTPSTRLRRQGAQLSLGHLPSL